jgi:hypothetical protein
VLGGLEFYIHFIDPAVLIGASQMKYIHVRNIEKFHPGYKDRELSWAKIGCRMAQGDPDCEMIKDEIDWGRLIRLILIELEAQKPLPLDDEYLTRKGFNIKKRSILLTLEVLHNFVEVVTEDLELCNVEKRREEKEEEKRREEGNDPKLCNRTLDDAQKVCNTTFVDVWNMFCADHPTLPQIKEITGSRKTKLAKRKENPSFVMSDILSALKDQPFLLGANDRNWVASFDWIIENDTNFIKILEKKYASCGKSDEPSPGVLLAQKTKELRHASAV